MLGVVLDVSVASHAHPNLQVGNISADRAVWERPENMTMPRPTYQISTKNGVLYDRGDGMDQVQKNMARLPIVAGAVFENESGFEVGLHRGKM